ncbi:MAG: hypothetical protein ACYDIA_05485 [Candidatus Humimicrobiaceae bacterium]
MANLINTTITVDNAYFFLFTTFEKIKDNNLLFDNIWKSTEKNELRELVKF